MATSLAAQLQALKTAVKVDAEPLKRPFTRPSILFNPKDAADIDIQTIFALALSGLDVLINLEERFRSYKSDLFSHKSRELDRELMGIEENNKINTSIGSYLRLLAGYFESVAARRTLEYLIRRYKIHVYNVEDLILCVLPYHETREFVRVVQLIDPGNSRWTFLNGVKTSGAPLPRKVIVQQCVKDLGVLEVICNYGTPTRKIQPLRPVTSFCTAVAIEVLGSTTTVDNDIVKRLLPYIASGLQPGAKGILEQKAGALMVVGLLAQKVALSPSLVKSLLRSVAEVAREDAKMSNDLQWFRMSFMALINLVQLQHLEAIPKKIVDILTEIWDISQILSGLMKEFNIDTFVAVLLNSLLEYSSSDKNCHQTLMTIIETVPLEDSVNRLVSKLLKTCVRMSRSKDHSVATESDVLSYGASLQLLVGGQTKQILFSLYKKYPDELRQAVREILQDTKLQSGKEGSNFELLCRVLDGDSDFSSGIPDSKVWFALEHPKAEVRRSALTGLDLAGILSDNATDSKGIDITRDAIVRRLEDADLSVVGAVLLVKRLSEMIDSQVLINALQNVLKRCILLIESSSNNKSLASDVAVACLQLAVMSFKDQDEYTSTLAAMIFPLVLVQPKTQRINLKALELSKGIKWPFYGNLISISSPEKKLRGELISSVNLDNISKLAEFLAHCRELMPWLVESCNAFEASKTSFFLILLKLFTMPIADSARFSALYDDTFQILRSQWELLELAGNVPYSKEVAQPNIMMLDGDCKRFVEHLDTSSEKLNREILMCLFQRLLEAFTKTVPEDDLDGMWLSKLQELFIFFASQAKHVFRGHLHYLVSNCKILSPQFLSKLFTEEGVSVGVQAECLHSFSHLCSQLKDEPDGDQTESPNSVSHLSSRLEDQLLQEFPSILVPLASGNQDVRAAAMSCIEGLFAIWSRRNLSRCKNGKSAFWVHFLGDLLGMIIQQKSLILSDRNFLPSFFKALLSSSSNSLLVQQTIGKRFDQSTQDEILAFLLVSAVSLSVYGKLKIFSLLKELGSKITKVSAIKSLLYDLLKRRQDYHIAHDKLSQKMSKTELDILCLLLESCTMTTSTLERNGIDDLILKTLELNGNCSEDPVISEPCMTVLRNLSNSLYGGLKTETQELIFCDLVILLRNASASIQDAAREALLRIDISCSVVIRILESVLEHIDRHRGSALVKKKKKASTHQGSILDVFQQSENVLSFVSSLLDVVLLKKNIENRSSLVGSLFKLVGKFFLNDEGVNGTEDDTEEFIQASSGVSRTVSSPQAYIQQELLLILEDISSSFINDSLQKGVILDQFDVELLVKCARSTKDAVTRNHVFSLFSILTKVIPDKVLKHILDILIVTGESVITQWDSYSQRVFEDLISAVVPFWLSKTGDVEKLLQIFVDVLPQVAQSQRLSIVTHVLRNLGESSSFSLMIFLLFSSLVSNKSQIFTVDRDPSLDLLTSVISSQWEYLFAKQLSEQYSCTIWLPSIVLLLQKIGASFWNDQLFMQVIVSMQFVLEKLLDPEIAFKIETGEDSDMIQGTIGDLMEQFVCLLVLVDSNRKHMAVSSPTRKKLKEKMHIVLKTIVEVLAPSTYFNVIVKLLRHMDTSVRKKAIGLLCETVKEISTQRGSNKSIRNMWLQLDQATQKCFNDMCVEILRLVDDSSEDPAGAPLKVSAIRALEVLANRFPSDDSAFSMCLNSVGKNISSNNPAVSSSCLRTTGALIDVLGPRALPELPGIMESLFSSSSNLSSFITVEIQNLDKDTSAASMKLRDSILVSFLVTLEAVVDKLGGFLNPYLSNILEIVVLHPCYASVSEVRMKAKVDALRKLIADRIPVRFLLPSLLRVYSEAVRSGESSISVEFEMLGSITSSMDKTAVAAYQVQIVDLCLQALDLRSQRPASVKHINVVEEKVINAMVVLTTKLTETMFKPLFVKSIEWSGSHIEENELNGSKTVDRAISFYGLVNKLAETHRSLFVPYFKYVLDGCVRHLTDAEDTPVGLTQKKKKMKLQAGSSEKKYVNRRLTVETWHLRALILSSLHKCFLHDTGNLRFLDSSNFQVLLKPLISQLVTDPPSSLYEHPNIPSVKEVDDLLIVCIGQMAVTAGSDLLWKPLNHEVLMQTRCERVRSRILGLRVVKYLVENLKEEYLVLMPETIPFLGELLEDAELPVKTLAQEVLKEMESMSGESLRDYL